MSDEAPAGLLDSVNREIAQLKERVEAASCGCLYCSTGDSFNCVRRRNTGVKHPGRQPGQGRRRASAVGSTPTTPIRPRP